MASGNVGRVFNIPGSSESFRSVADGLIKIKNGKIVHAIEDTDYLTPGKADTLYLDREKGGHVSGELTLERPINIYGLDDTDTIWGWVRLSGKANDITQKICLLVSDDKNAPIIISGIAEPIDDTDSANKAYVDAKSLLKDGDTFTKGRLLLGTDTNESELGVYLLASYNDGNPWVEFYGTDNDEPVRLLNIADPTRDGEAANKKYVDESIKSAILDTWEASY